VVDTGPRAFARTVLPPAARIERTDGNGGRPTSWPQGSSPSTSSPPLTHCWTAGPMNGGPRR